MSARFILSLDCEGKWGVADHLTADHHATLSDKRLRKAYGDILAALDEFDIPASFAFVGAFTLSAQRLKVARPQLLAHSRHLPGYLEPALEDMAAPNSEGWAGDWALAAVEAARTPHEVALHGVTHAPWDWPGMTRDIARREIQLLSDIEAPIAGRVSTFIYPRNAVAHTDVLGEFGIEAYRLARPFGSRVASLASEFNLFSPPEADEPAGEGPLAIPAGYFINWLHGPRRLAPIGLSRARARLMLERAAASGGVVHYWTHPENIASAPATLKLLRGILEDVARLRDAGRCEVLTQRNYSRALAVSAVAAA